MTTTAMMKTKVAVADPTMSGSCSCHDFGGSALGGKERKWLLGEHTHPHTLTPFAQLKTAPLCVLCCNYTSEVYAYIGKTMPLCSSGCIKQNGEQPGTNTGIYKDCKIDYSALSLCLLNDEYDVQQE